MLYYINYRNRICERAYLREEGARMWMPGELFERKKEHRSRPLAMLSELIYRYHRHDVAQQSAALAYYLLFTLFPMLIFVSSLLGLLQIQEADALELLSTVLPDAVVDLCATYLGYVSQTATATMFWFSLVFSIYFPMRAANCLMRSVRRAYGLKRPTSLVRHYLRVLLFTAVLILVVVASLLLMTFGQRLLLYLAGRFLFMTGIIHLWHYLRFFLLALLLFATLGMLYALAQDERQEAGAILPGAVCALVGWMVVSVGFSFYVENFAHYSVIYGTLGAVIVLMIWLFLSSVTLIMGSEYNGARLSLKGATQAAPTEGKET